VNLGNGAWGNRTVLLSSSCGFPGSHKKFAKPVIGFCRNIQPRLNFICSWTIRRSPGYAVLSDSPIGGEKVSEVRVFFIAFFSGEDDNSL
jgi:hypothetical protein